MRFTGRLCRGKGEAAGFTQLAWVKEQCQDGLGFTPYPGTVNLKVKPEVAAAVGALARDRGITLISPEPAFCDAKVLPVRLYLGEADMTAAVVWPLVAGYYEDILELLAPVKVIAAWRLDEGAELEVDTAFRPHHSC